MIIKVFLVKVFTNDPKAGNPAGVILNADNFTTDQMQRIAAELDFSESVFVSKSGQADCRMRYFSPIKEVNYCAHATIAACSVMMNSGTCIKSHETNIGVFKINFDEVNSLIALWQESPVMGACIDPKLLAPLLGISIEKIDLSLPCQIVSTGIPKLMIPIKSLQDLFDINPDFEGIKVFCTQTGARGFYPFTLETIVPESNFHARQFNPLAGINEDPITGVAAGALVYYWSYYRNQLFRNYIVEQGYIMNKFGKVYVSLDNKNVIIGGHAIYFGEKKFDI